MKLLNLFKIFKILILKKYNLINLHLLIMNFRKNF